MDEFSSSGLQTLKLSFSNIHSLVNEYTLNIIILFVHFTNFHLQTFIIYLYEYISIFEDESLQDDRKDNNV